jgi:hypothetical protein
MIDSELKKMVLDHMEKGFLDNIIDMFRHDEQLYPLIIDMIKDERMRVRLGGAALVEELAKTSREPFIVILPTISELLKDSSATIRGDAAYLLGVIGLEKALPCLIEASKDEDENVRSIALDALKQISRPKTANSV